MIKSKEIMIQLKNKKCSHSFSKNNETCICPECWLDLVSENIKNKRNKIYRESNYEKSMDKAKVTS